MLIQLDIENIAIIERASIEFGKGLNVITGETGAGKSLLINSLNMVLGNRSNRDFIREGADFARVSAVFLCKEIDYFLEKSGVSSDDGNVVISRKLYRDGRNLCHINGCAVNVSLLKSIGEKLVVIHGQHDSSALMDTSSHINFLDEFAKNKVLLSEYRDVYMALKDAKTKLEQLNLDEKSRISEIDYLTYQTEEIEKANLSPEEENELVLRKTILENSEALNSLSRKAYSAIGGDSGAKDILYDVKRSLEKLCEIDSSAEEFSKRAEDLYYEAEELGRDLSSYISGIEFNPSELSEIEDRLDAINTLKRKYGGDVIHILEFYDSASEKLNYLKGFDENKEHLEKEIEFLESDALRLSAKITKSRRDSSHMLSERLISELESLDMPNCIIDFEISSCPLTSKGAETVELMISTNPSEKPKSLSKIASGGEISRVMLAIKSVFSDFDHIPTLLFDEIDSGVSGRAAEKIANKMKTLSKSFQIITVTHLPIIAASAENHFLLEKTLTDDGYRTKISELDRDERIHEIARIISGDNINSISLENAAQMLDAKEE